VPVQPGAVRRLFEKSPRGWLGLRGDWLLDDRHLVVSVTEQGDHGGPLWMADTVTEQWQRLTSGPLQLLSPMVSCGGRVLANISRSDENAIEIPLDNSAIRPLLAGFRREQYPVWSPVAEQILFVSNELSVPE
jgi:hypothetical protein